MNQLSTKSCYKCKLVKELSEFAKNGNHLTYCKPCNSALQRYHQTKDPVRIASNKRRWAQENRLKIKAQREANNLNIKKNSQQ